METNKKWIKAGERLFQQANPAGCLNLNHDAASFLNLLSDAMRMYGIGTSNVPMFLSMLAKLEVPVFLGSFYPDKIDRRIHILPEPVDIKIDMQSDESKLTLQAGYEYDGVFTLLQNQVDMISINPAWVLMDDRVAQLRNAQALSIYRLKRGEHYIKLADGSIGQIHDEWLEKYKHLWNMAEETENGFRVSDFHLPLLDKLLEDDETLHPPSDLIQRHERFRHFEQIAPQPLPKHFTGELRAELAAPHIHAFIPA